MNFSHRDIRAAKFPALVTTKRALIILSLLLIAHLGATAQQFAFRHYAQDEGLQNLDVFQLMQDKAGFLWSATENGLFRYDGSQFRRYGAADGIQESMVIAIYQDASSRIWIATPDHLYYFANDRFHIVPSGHVMQIDSGQRVLTSLDPQHILLINHASLLLAAPAGSDQHWTLKPYFTPHQLANHPELSQLHSILTDSDGTLWLGCGPSLCRVHGDRVDVFGPQQGIPRPAAWLSLFRDTHGTLWVRSPHYIRVLTPGSSRFEVRDIPDSQSRYFGVGILCFSEDPSGDILTQSTTGLARWNGSSWQIFDGSNGINFSYITTILFDHQGSPWFSTRGQGLARWLGYGLIQNWTVAQGLRDNIVWTIYRDHQNRLWVGDQLQVNLLDPKLNRFARAPRFPPDLFQQADGITQSTNGAYWVTSLPGFVMYASPRAAQFTLIDRLPEIVRLFTDSSHRIWFCTRSGLYVARNPATSISIEKIDHPLISIDSFSDAAEATNHDLWFVSNHHLYRLSHSDNSWTEIPLAAAVTRGDIRVVAAAPDGTLWIGGGLSSLFHLKIQDNHAQVLAALAPPEIVSTDIQFIRFDHRGWLWIGTDLGVNVFDGTHWKLLTQRDGLLSNDTNEGAFYVDADDSIWIGVNGGATHLTHPPKLFYSSPLHVMLTSAVLGDKNLNVAGGRNVWRWRDSPLDLAFTSLNFDRDGSIRFRYKLSGLEDDWSQTTEHLLHYAAVPPGNYRFEIQALDPNQYNASPVAALGFIIHPPWWRTQIFYLALAFLSLALSFLLWRWREGQLMREHQSLEQLIAQRTSELQTEKLELIAAREALLHQASHDPLTSLWNRSAILDILKREMNRAHREHTRLAVVLADLDHFKQINDTHGHLAGDSILRDAAHRMSENIRPYDFIGRYGGEEFLIVLPGLSIDEPFSRLTQLHHAMSEKPFLYEGTAFHVTSSFGSCGIDDTMMTVEDMVRCADEALYRAKASGRNRIIFHSPTPSNPIIEIP